MTQSSPDCVQCPVQPQCLPFQLGLAGDNAQADVPRRRVERAAGELVLGPDERAEILTIRSGWCARYVMFPDGRRQITDVALPGEFVGCAEVVASNETIPIVALSDADICVFDRVSFLSAVTACPKHTLSVMKVCGSQAIRLRNLLAAMGRQSGAPRIAAFLLAMHRRLVAIGQANETDMPCHLRQQDLADIQGMTQVHVSRTLRSLEEGHVLSIRGRALRILDHGKLERFARG